MTVYRKRKQAPTAAQDERVLATPGPKLKPKKATQAPTAAQDERVLAQPGPAPVKTEPLEPPEPFLQTYGFQKPLSQFVQRLHDATKAHIETFGYKPSPGFAFDLARWDGPDYKALFRASQEPVPVKTDEQFFQEITDAIREGRYEDYKEENEGEIEGLFKRKPALAAKALALSYKDDTEEELLEAQGFPLMGVAEKLDNPITRTVGLAGEQVADSLVGSPGGAYLLGKGYVLDWKNIASGDIEKATRTSENLKAMAKQSKTAWSDPANNPGYIFLDALAVLTAGGGTAARISAAGKAAKGSKAAALLKRPRPGTKTISKGGLKEEALLSENSFVRVFQRKNLERRQRKSDLRHVEGAPLPGGMLGPVIPQSAREWWQRNFSFERKIGREAQTRRRYEHTLSMGLKRELDAVAGMSINQARVFARMPRPMRKGLSRGEQKAIQVHSWDDPNPLQAERNFHQWAIDNDIGDAKAHKRQLADLKLAEKALENPSPRLQKALQLTREVIEEQQRIKVEELGLSPVTAESRVARTGAVLRREEEGARKSSESFYLPVQPKGKARVPVSERYGYFSPRKGPGGIPPAGADPSLTHVFEGKAIRAGDFRIDATTLAGESYSRAVRAATIRNEHSRLWKAATDEPKSQFDVPIRDVKQIPDKLRSIMANLDEGRFTAKDAAALDPDDVALILREMYPSPKDAANIKGVKWVDSRLLGDENRVPPATAPRKAVQAVNEVIRVPTLFLRPAYALNLLGNVAMGLIHQGPFLPVNVARAVKSKRIYGDEAARTLDSLVGEGRARSYVTPETRGPSQALSQAWGRITDRDLRVSALLEELRKKGYKTPEEVRAVLKDKSKRADVIEASRRANKSMVEFDNLTWFEKNTMRHIIFVYPWVSRSAVWSLRTIMEHPIKTDFLSHLGRLNEDEYDEYFKHAPEWFKRTGYFPAGFKDGKPVLVNPTSVNSFATLNELLFTAESAFSGDVQYSSTEDLLGPFARFAIHGATGRDEFGNEYPNGDWFGAAQEVIMGLPQTRAVERAKEKDGKAPPLDLTDRGTLGKRERAAMEMTVFSPGWLNGYGSLLVGGLSPRLYNPDAAAARYWRDRPMEERHKHEMRLINKALGMQGELLGKKVPQLVRDAVNLAGERELGYKKFQEEERREPTIAERTTLDLKLLKEKGLVTEAESRLLSKRFKELNEKEEYEDFRRAMLQEFGGAEALQDWDSDVRWVASFRPSKVKEDLEFLRSKGMADTAIVGKDLKELGRKTLEYQHEAIRQARQLKRKDLTSDERRAIEYQLRAWEATQDVPISVGGKKYPSAVKFAWARTNPKDRQAHLDSIVTRDWKTLSNFDKELLGKKPDPKLSKGWVAFNQYMTEAKAVKGLDPSYGPALAKWVDRYGDNGKPVPGFYKDYLFAQRLKFRRMEALTPIQRSPHKNKWQTIFSYAKALEPYLKSDDYSSGEVRDTWKTYVNQTLFPWVQEDKKFEAEVNRYGGLRVLLGLLNR